MSDDYVEKIVRFKECSFSGAEVLAITDCLGAGVGATMSVVDRLVADGLIPRRDGGDPATL